uniref:Uncharacterized protein n=1 Tax=Herposiphonia versicolor TaxID=2007163 RepID=A0A1Z1MFQ2_9FLOR|nr:hypothetical protein [Herposiphonia versicolor]ARW64719.1 hypothetical protein [Herposiphonia versicolor]
MILIYLFIKINKFFCFIMNFIFYIELEIILKKYYF